MFKLYIVIVLLIYSFSVICPAGSAEPLRNDGIKHLYIENGVENVILKANKLNFKKEAEMFGVGRIQYAVLWTGIVVSLIVYFNSRRSR